MELICGGCSQDQGLALHERMKIAKSRLPEVVYTCPVCAREHAYQGVGGKIGTTEPSDEAQAQTQPQTKKSEKIDDSDQLSLS